MCVILNSNCCRRDDRFLNLSLSKRVGAADAVHVIEGTVAVAEPGRRRNCGLDEIARNNDGIMK